MLDHLNSMLEEAGHIAHDFDIEPYTVDETQQPACVTPTYEKPVAHKAGKSPLSKKTWKKPADKPKRPLSSYNLFFQHEREKIITNNPEVTLETVLYKIRNTIKPKKRKHRKSHGMIGFAELARTIADKWKTIDDEGRGPYEEVAAEEKAKYKLELERWTKMREEKSREEEKRTPLEHNTVQVVYDEQDTLSYYTPYIGETRPRPGVTPEAIESLIMSGNSLRRKFAHLNPNSDVRDYLQMTQQTIEMARASLSLPLFRNLNVPTHILPGGSLGYPETSSAAAAVAAAPSDFASSIFSNSYDHFGSEDILGSMLSHDHL